MNDVTKLKEQPNAVTLFEVMGEYNSSSKVMHQLACACAERFLDAQSKDTETWNSPNDITFRQAIETKWAWIEDPEQHEDHLQDMIGELTTLAYTLRDDVSWCVYHAIQIENPTQRAWSVCDYATRSSENSTDERIWQCNYLANLLEEIA